MSDTQHPSSGSPGCERLAYVDGLRGLAALGVMWFHLYTQNGGDASAAVPRAFGVVSVWGRFGVQLFFALSGFVLAYTLVVTPRICSLSDLVRYFVKRSTRLDIPYWGALAIYLLLAPALNGYY
jgi:peptidoglycan/LPS O-acetylase OafA/YrhL